MKNRKKEKPKSLDGLMKYLRDFHKINIKGSSQKQKLRNIGYFHGFKGYRYIKTPNNKIAFSDLNQILSLNKFDMHLKSLFYTKIMFIETALKNYVLEIILEESKSDNFIFIYDNLLTNYRNYEVGSPNYTKKINKRLKLRNNVYNTLSQDFSNSNKIVSHFYENECNVPIWAIFECLTLGGFGNFVSCLNNHCKKEIEKLLNFSINNDSSYEMLENIIFVLKDLRNSIAHNNIIFDTRFKRSKAPKKLEKYMFNELNICNIDFNTITDYVILVSYLLKCINTSKTEIKKFISDFENIVNQFYEDNSELCNKILSTDTKNKLQLLRNFI